MMNSANFKTDKDHDTTDQTLNLNHVVNKNGGNCKKTSLPTLQLMKPSLSLTSLPPQSPNELITNEGSNERAYNSLKVRK